MSLFDQIAKTANPKNYYMKPIKYFVKEITWLGYSSTGWGNGYACLPKGHKYFGVDYDNIPVDIHGGLTFSSKSEKCEWPELPEECRADHWIVGFDCAHYGDTPSSCPKSYVEMEAKNLATQLEAL